MITPHSPVENSVLITIAYSSSGLAPSLISQATPVLRVRFQLTLWNSGHSQLAGTANQNQLPKRE